MQLTEKQYAKILKDNQEHCRWTINFITNVFKTVRRWVGIAYPPDDVTLIATMRIYQSENGSRFIKLGNHASYTAGYWFEEQP